LKLYRVGGKGVRKWNSIWIISIK